jgi:hypothetical protein
MLFQMKRKEAAEDEEKNLTANFYKQKKSRAGGAGVRSERVVSCPSYYDSDLLHRTHWETKPVIVS